MRSRLEEIGRWYLRMIHPDTGILAYSYDPSTRFKSKEFCPIRDMGGIWSMATLYKHFDNKSAFKGLQELCRRSMRVFSGFLCPQQTDSITHLPIVHFNSKALNEPANIAHNAFFLLALIAYGSIEENETHEFNHLIESSANGIVSQQRANGSLSIYFDANLQDNDGGIELYPGEACLALLKAYRLTLRMVYLECVEKAFQFYSGYYRSGNIDSDYHIFFSNWQSQMGRELYELTSKKQLSRSVKEYQIELHQKTVNGKYYSNLLNHPERYATVEVACGLEGLLDTIALMDEEEDKVNLELFRRSSKEAIAFLFKIQDSLPAENEGRGGFGNLLTDTRQRVDVTGHVMNAFLKSIKLGIEP